ncbi:hypothetical protein Scep_026595 [Stephania cephalantha]|uniref:Uncharacterized protein n=1 Tax=Stephania cephalantha TaxID=152367 RepID=A0AAP0EKH3_9MAGN
MESQLQGCGSLNKDPIFLLFSPPSLSLLSSRVTSGKTKALSESSLPIILPGSAPSLLVCRAHKPPIPLELLSASSFFANKHVYCITTILLGSRPPLVRILLRALSSAIRRRLLHGYPFVTLVVVIR